MTLSWCTKSEARVAALGAPKVFRGWRVSGIAASLVALPALTHRLFSCLAPISNIIINGDPPFGALDDQEREQLTTLLGRLNQRLQEPEEGFREQTDSVLVQAVMRKET
jgi:hypothetical protein